jgi:signal transduction histidine kinase/ligand-binding sensor domain-containing protein
MRKLLTILLFIPAFCFAQGRYLFNRIGTEDGLGLTSNQVYCTYQDEQGYYWLGTANGLQRFDGNRFISFGRSKPLKNELPVSAITQLVPFESNLLWVLLPSLKKIGLFNTRTFKFTEVPVMAKVNIGKMDNLRLYRDSRGNVFLFVWKYGLFKYDATARGFVTSNFFKLPRDWVPSIYFFEDTKTNRFFLPCPDKGLAIYDYAAQRLYTSEYNPQNIPLLRNASVQKGISEVFIDSKRRHWFFAWSPHRVYYCLDSNGNMRNDTAGIFQNKEYSELRYFFETKNKTVWFYGNNGLFSLAGNTNRLLFYPQREQSLSAIRYQWVYHVMEDRDGLIWFSTNSGLYYLPSLSEEKSVVNLYVEEEGRPTEINDVIELQSGELALATWGHGVLTFNARLQRTPNSVLAGMPKLNAVSTIQYRQAWSLHEDRNGILWIGCQGGKFIRHNRAAGTSVFDSFPAPYTSTIHHLTEDGKGNIWFGTRKGEVLRYNGQQFELVLKTDYPVRKILAANTGDIWVATEGAGVFWLDATGKQKQHFSVGSSGGSLFLDNAVDLDQLNDSVIVCAAAALNFINTRTGKVSWATIENGLPGNSVQRVRKDRRGYLWLNTNDGLCRFNPQNKTLTLYGKKDGLEYERMAVSADYVCRNGQIVFAGSSYLLVLKPEKLENQTAPPDVAITELWLQNHSLRLDSFLNSKASFLHNQNSLTIRFSALSFQQRDKLSYYYRLAGATDEWVQASRQQEVSFSLLPPGNYRFEVYSVDIDGRRSKNITGFSFAVQPPFWRAWWFIALVAIVTALLIYYLYRQRINKLLAVEAVRSRVARDLHDDVGSTLSTINILGSMAKTRLHEDMVKTGEYIGKITENSQRMMEAMDDIVWSIRPDNDTVQKMTVRMKEFALSVLEAKDIAVQIKVDDNVGAVKLNMEARRDLFLIFKEAVNNVAKYSGAGNVFIHLACHNKRLVLTVKDDGVGFDPRQADGNGLGNMEKRATALRGRFQLQTKPGAGTSITVNIPVS